MACGYLVEWTSIEGITPLVKNIYHYYHMQNSANILTAGETHSNLVQKYTEWASDRVLRQFVSLVSVLFQ